MMQKDIFNRVTFKRH